MAAVSRATAAAEVRAATRALSSEIDALDEMTAQHFGLNRTDLRCVDILRSTGPLTASKLAQAVGLTSGGLSIALERLEAAGYVRRRPHDRDRRSVVVETTAKVEAAEAAIFVGLGQRMHAVLSGYTVAELTIIGRYLTEVAMAITETRNAYPAEHQSTSR